LNGEKESEKIIDILKGFKKMFKKYKNIPKWTLLLFLDGEFLNI
jgi:hypothetical protein